MKSPNFSCALVTGSSSGIGSAVASLLADRGIALILTARSQDKLDDLAKELSPLVPVEVIRCDLSDSEQREKLVKVIQSRVPDLIVNNAGFGYYGDVISHKTEKMKEMVEVDVTALMELSIEGVKALIGAKRPGVIMNVSSAAAFQIFPSFSVYAASKAFVNLFSESFDAEVSSEGVRVLACCPGMVDTDFRYRASGNSNLKASANSMTVDFAAKEIWDQIQKGKPIHIFDWKYCVLTFISRYLLPKKLIAKVMRSAVKNRCQ